MQIVNNFGKIHSDLQELKNEYIQEQQNNLVQIGDNTLSPEENLQIQIDSEEKLLQLKEELQEKQAQITGIVQQFKNMHADLQGIKNDFAEGRAQDQVELSMLKKQSSSGHKTHKRRHSVKASL